MAGMALRRNGKRAVIATYGGMAIQKRPKTEVNGYVTLKKQMRKRSSQLSVAGEKWARSTTPRMKLVSTVNE